MSVIDLYSNYLANTPPTVNFNINGNSVKVWHDDLFGVIYIEISDWLSLNINDTDSWISKYFSKKTPYRYIKLDTETKVVTYCSIIYVNDKDYIQETIKEYTDNISKFMNNSKLSENFETSEMEKSAERINGGDNDEWSTTK